MLLKPSGRFPVGVKDVKYASGPIAADSHVVGRLYYPAKRSSGWLSQPMTWIRDWNYAQGYVSWGLHSPSTVKEKLLKSVASSTIYAIGSTQLLRGTYNAAAEDGQGSFPVIIFSHGAASMRNTYSILCSEFASRGFVVAAVEHADGTACCVELATGEWRLLQRLGSGSVLEAKCDYRVQECVTMAQVLQSMNSGSTIPGVSLSGPEPPCSAFKGLLDMRRLALMGHSCGGATAAAAVATHAEFKCGVALAPWWPLLPSASPALKGWQTNSPLLVLGSNDWNKPETMYCGGERQRAVFQAALPSSSSSTSSTSRVAARIPVVAAAAAAANDDGNGNNNDGSSGTGGGVLLVVPRGSKHASFTDLPFLVPTWLATVLRKMTGAKAANTAAEVDAAVIQDVITWSAHNFLTAHLPLKPGAVSSLNQHQQWQRQQHQQDKSTPDASAAAATAAPASADAAGSSQGSRQLQQKVLGAAAAVSAAGGESLVDHLAADENMMRADERAAASSSSSGSGAGAGAGAAAVVPPQAHAVQHDRSLERATSAELDAAAGQLHLPVQAVEEKQYKQHLGDRAYLVGAHTR